MQARNDTTLEDRDFAVLVAATAAELGDSYCSLAWGGKLAALSDEHTAAAVLRGRESDLTDRDVALARWARRVVRDPNSTTDEDVRSLREAGLGDKEIVEATAFVAFRLAFSTVNDALGAQPDSKLAEHAPEAVRRAVSYGRPPASS
jgi:alkylhydroperoxidase family enzyme